VSQLPGERGSLMGTLNAITSFGQIAGTVCAGMIIAGWVSARVFWTVAAMGVLSLPSASRSATHPPPERRPRSRCLRAIECCSAGARSLRHHVRYISALPFSLSVSFYPILLIEQGSARKRLAGSSNASPGCDLQRASCSRRFVKHADDSSVPLASALAVAASVGLVALFTNPATSRSSSSAWDRVGRG